MPYSVAEIENELNRRGYRAPGEIREAPQPGVVPVEREPRPVIGGGMRGRIYQGGITYGRPQVSEQREEPGYASIVGKGLMRGTMGMAQGVGAATRWAGEVSGGRALAEMGATASQYWNKAIQEGRFKPDEEVFAGSFWENPSLKRATGIVAEAVPSLGAAVVASIAATPAAGAAMLGLLEGAPQYEEAREAGKGVGEASVYGGLSTVGTALLEYLPIGRMFKRGKAAARVAKTGAGKAAVKGTLAQRAKERLTRPGVLSATWKGGVEEAGQEASQQIYQNLIARIGYDESRSITEGVIESIIGGAGAGGIAGGTIAKIEQAKERAKKRGATDQELNILTGKVSRETQDFIVSKAATTVKTFLNTGRDDQGNPFTKETARDIAKKYREGGLDELANAVDGIADQYEAMRAEKKAKPFTSALEETQRKEAANAGRLLETEKLPDQGRGLDLEVSQGQGGANLEQPAPGQPGLPGNAPKKPPKARQGKVAPKVEDVPMFEEKPGSAAGEKEPAKMSLLEIEAAGIEPWQVTRSRWVEVQREERRRLGQSEESGTRFAPFADYEAYHRNAVKEAHSEGKPVSPEVLKDYPDLQGAPPKAEIDAAAHEAATSPDNALPEPTEGQIEAGNYRKGHINLHGLDISIENPAGSTRKGVSPEGKKWETLMHDHYGYIRGGFIGKDKDHVDVFVGPKQESDQVYVVNQVKPGTTQLDEHKVMLSYSSEQEAKKAYLRNYEKGWKGLGSIAPMSLDQFKEWLEKGDKKKPAEGMQETMQPWEMPQSDFVAGRDKKDHTIAYWQGYHKSQVEWAVKKGKQVPIAVLEDYPDLAGHEPAPKAIEKKTTVASVLKRYGKKSIDELTLNEAEILSNFTDNPLGMTRNWNDMLQYLYQSTGLRGGKVMELTLGEAKRLTTIEQAAPKALPAAKEQYEEKAKEATALGETSARLLKEGGYIVAKQQPRSEKGEANLLKLGYKPYLADLKTNALVEHGLGTWAKLPAKEKAKAETPEIKPFEEIPLDKKIVVKTHDGAVGEIVSGKTRTLTPEQSQQFHGGSRYLYEVTVRSGKFKDRINVREQDIAEIKEIGQGNPWIPFKPKLRETEEKAPRPETAEKKAPSIKVFDDQPFLVERKVARLLEDLGLLTKIMEGEDAYVKVKNEPYLDLVIERHPGYESERYSAQGEHLLLTHYIHDEASGDTWIDSEMVFKIHDNGMLALVETSISETMPKARGLDRKFAELFAKNLKSEGFNKGKVVWPRKEAAPAAETKTVESEKPFASLAEWVRGKLESADKAFSSADLFTAANKAFGGTQAEGKYVGKDAYDAMELGVNQYILKSFGFETTFKDAEDAAREVTALKNLISFLPTQTRRTEEQQEFQQFSTPPPLAYIVNWAANIKLGDTILEPSAGIGGIAVFAKKAGAKVIVNELSKRRLEHLKELPFDAFYNENAEQIHNILPADVKPTVVVMNPPFSATAGRMAGKRQTMFSTQHIEQALKRLEPNGRLVMIVGEGMADDAPLFRQWWKKIKAEYNVLANIGISGDEYKKYGTTFGNRIIIIDKTGETRDNIITGQVEKLEELLPLLKGVRDERTHPGERKSTERVGEASAEGAQGGVRRPAPVLSATGAVGAGERAGAGTRESEIRASEQSGGAALHPEAGGGLELPHRPQRGRRGKQPGMAAGEGAGVPESAATGGAHGTASASEVRGGVRGEVSPEPSPSVVEVEERPPETRPGELTASIYEEYHPQRVRVSGAKNHPGKLVESAAMAAVLPPKATYQPSLPKEAIESGRVSEAQIEPVIYAGMAHEQFLPDGSRKGYYIGDGTGVGKGREISSIIWDNWQKGRKKAVWISQNHSLVKDAERDIEGVGWDKSLLIKQAKVKADQQIEATQGILFTAYSTLRSGFESDARAKSKTKKPSRLDQVVKWLGEDFDGVIAFDEAHSMGNAIAARGIRGVRQPSEQALAGLDLQRKLPKARIVYVSATGASQPMNLAYAERLGLWGAETPFPTTQSFINGIEQGGLAAMEFVARDLKALGSYTARSLSYDDVTYERLEHKLTKEQREIYDSLAGAWQVVLQNVRAAFQVTGQSSHSGKALPGSSAKNFWSQFWGNHQRFFNQIITAIQLPSVIAAIEKNIANGEAAVIQLVNTNEAAQTRAMANLQEGQEIEDLDITPRQALMEMVQDYFPVQQYEQYLDEEGKVRTRPVVDSQGKPVINQEAVAMREALLDKLGAIKVPDNPLDTIINHFGHEKVAEVTGRGRRLVKDDTGKLTQQSWSRSKSDGDADLFSNDKKQILVFSEAGGTGRSYHADLTYKNQRRRNHYLLQAGWRAENALQGLGRTHRSNQKQAPHDILVSTDLHGQKRFISTIARRLSQLGALTKGARQTGDQGFFQARDNLESTQARDALNVFFRDLYRNRIPTIAIEDFEEQTGLRLRDDYGSILRELPEMTQFLNRLLSLKIDMQNKVFDAFQDRLDEAISAAMANGTLDAGVETIHALKIDKVSEQTVYTDPKSGAETKYVQLDITNPTPQVTFEDAEHCFFNSAGFFKNLHSGRIWVASNARERTDMRSGQVVEQHSLMAPNHSRQTIDRPILLSDKWEHVPADQARKLWQAELDALPKTETHREHMITGAILPIWDRLIGHVRVGRVQTATGERMLGRIISPKDIPTVLRNLQAELAAIKLPPEELSQKLMAGQTAQLSNEWTISRRKVGNEWRLEIDGPTYEHLDELKRDGVFTERINWNTRYFIPTGAEAPSVLAKITKTRPVVMLEPAKKTNSQESEEEEIAFALRAPKGKGTPGRRTYGIPTSVTKVVTSYYNNEKVRTNRYYAEAKAGNRKAAAKLVLEMVKPETVDAVKAQVGEGAIFAAPNAIEEAGKNKIPRALANYYAIRTGGTVDTAIVQGVRAFHTGAKAMERLISRATFDGEVIRGGRYVLVDDVTTLGGTLAELANHIQANGGQVVGVITLTNAARSATMQPHQSLIDEIERRYGREIRNLFGIEPRALTAAEAGYLIGFRDVDSLRNRATAARSERRQRLLSKGIRSPEEVAPRSHLRPQGFAPGFTASALEDIVGKFLNLLPGAPIAEFYNSIEDVPYDKVQAEFRRGAGRIEAFYYKGKIHLIANNIQTVEGAFAATWHELSHFTCRQLFGDKYDQFLHHVFTSYGKAKLQDLANLYGYDLSTKEGRLSTADEKVARIIEKNQNPGLIRQLIALIRNLLRKPLAALGINLKITDNDILCLVAPRVRDFLMSTKPETLSVLREGLEPLLSRRPEKRLIEKADVPVTVLGKKQFGDEVWRAREAAFGWARKNLQGKTFRNEDQQWDIQVNRSGLQKVVSGTRSYQLEHLEAIRALPGLLRTAVLGESHAEKSGDPNIRQIHRFYAPLTIGDELYRVKLTVKETKEGRKFYDHSLTEIEMPEALRASYVQKEQGDIATASGTLEKPAGTARRDTAESGSAIPSSTARLSKISIPDLLQGATKNDGTKFDFGKEPSFALREEPAPDLYEYSSQADRIARDLLKLDPQKLDAEKANLEEELPRSMKDAGNRLLELWKKRKTGWKIEKPDTTVTERLLASPEFYFEKVPAAQKVFNAALEKTDNAHHLINGMLETKGGKGLIGSLEILKKENLVEYDRLKNLIIHADRNKLTLTAEDVKAKRFSDMAVSAWQDYRKIMDNGFDNLIAEFKNLIARYEAAGLDLPEIAVMVDGERVEVNLKKALAMMGDMRGYYAPRKRRSGRFMLKARKEGTNPILEFFDSEVFLTNRQVQLEGQGYKVEKTISGKMPEDVFQIAGQTIGTQAMINQALEHMEQKAPPKTLADFGLTSHWGRTSDDQRELIITGPASKKFTDIFKGLGGKWYKAGDGPKAWRFVGATKWTEKKIIRALGGMDESIVNTELMFAHGLAIEVANIIKGRGFRSSMIQRGEATGKDVWIGYEEDPIKNAIEYVTGIAHGLAKKTMAEKMVRAVTGTDIDWKDYDDYEEYLQEVKARRIDPQKQPNIFHDVKVYMEDMLRNEELSDRIIGMIKGIAVVKYLGGRVSAPLVNLTALVTSVPAAMNGYAGIPIHSTYHLLGDAAKMYGQYRFGDRSQLSPSIVELFDEIHDKGWNEAQYNHEALSVLQTKLGRGYDTAVRWSMLGFGATEQLNRVSTIVATYIGIKQRTPARRFNHQEALALAKKVSDRAHGVYNKVAWPYLARGSNLAAQIGRCFMVFKKFSHTYLQTMYDLGFTHKNRKALLYMMASPAVLAGAGASVVWPVLMGALRMLFDADDPEEEIYSWVEQNFGAETGNFMRYGLPGIPEHGISLKGSLQIGITDLPTSLVDILGAPGSLMGDIWYGGENILKGNVSKGVERLLPRALGAPFQGVREATEGVTTKSNAPVFYGTEQIKANTMDAIYRALSFNPTQIAKKKDILWSDRQVAEKYSGMRTDIYAKVRKFYLRPIEERSKADWIDIAGEIKEYNARVQKNGLAGIVPFIGRQSLKTAVRSTGRPPKAQIMKQRAWMRPSQYGVYPQYRQPAQAPGPRGGLTIGGGLDQ